MNGIIAIVVIFGLVVFFGNKESKFKEIERQQAMRRAILKLNEKD